MAKLTLTVELTDTEQAILKNDLVDINAWLQAAMTGKVNNCWKRMQSEWTTRLIKDDSFTDPIPSSKDKFVEMVTKRSDYKTRKEIQDAEDAAMAEQAKKSGT